MQTPSVEILWWRGCPSWERAVAMVREEMAVLGLDPEVVAAREIVTDRDAERERFVGSPTILVNGEDVEPPGQEPTGLTCRVYHRPGGGVSPLPDQARVRAALADAMEGEQQ